MTTYGDVLDQLALWSESDANPWATEALRELVHRFGHPREGLPTGKYSVLWRDRVTGDRVLVVTGRTRKQAKAAVAEGQSSISLDGEFEVVEETCSYV